MGEGYFPSRLHVSDSRSDVDLEETDFLGGVLGTTWGTSYRCDWGGLNGMG